jgi:3D (Asp-Asp-Asp) domain-containing protein
VARSLRVLIALAISLTAFAFAQAAASAGTGAWVDTGGDCLWLRAAPGLESEQIDCLDHGEALLLLDGLQEVDGFTWRAVTHAERTGWVADLYVSTDPAEVQPLFEPPGTETLGSTDVLPVPPEGGLTVGRAEVGTAAELAAAQPYSVVSVWHFDIALQRQFRFLPGAPSSINTLDALEAGDVVAVRRAGAFGEAGALPEASLTVAGTPNTLALPPVGGLTQGVAGTTDPRFLALAQPFAVESVSYFHVPSQRWLVYLPGAPDLANSLRQGQLRLDSIVTVRRGADFAPVEPELERRTRLETTVTYYYCVPGDEPASIGDGGGYCGTMANGERVHAGAAACAAQHLGQRFRIEGDPTARAYTCSDTGGSVLNDHRDIWFPTSDEGYAWWVTVGARAFIEILSD